MSYSQFSVPNRYVSPLIVKRFSFAQLFLKVIAIVLSFINGTFILNYEYNFGLSEVETSHSFAQTASRDSIYVMKDYIEHEVGNDFTSILVNCMLPFVIIGIILTVIVLLQNKCPKTDTANCVISVLLFLSFVAASLALHFNADTTTSTNILGTYMEYGYADLRVGSLFYIECLLGAIIVFMDFLIRSYKKKLHTSHTIPSADTIPAVAPRFNSQW